MLISDRGMEARMPAKLFRDETCLIDPARAPLLKIKLLQADNVSPRFGDHLCDSSLRAASIRSHAAVHVEGGNA